MLEGSGTADVSYTSCSAEMTAAVLLPYRVAERTRLAEEAERTCLGQRLKELIGWRRSQQFAGGYRWPAIRNLTSPVVGVSNAPAGPRAEPATGAGVLDYSGSMLPNSETRVQHVTLATTLAKAPSPIRIQPLTETNYRGKRASAGWSVVAEGQVYVFPAEVTRPQVAEWLMRHGYRLAAKGEWRRA